VLQLQPVPEPLIVYVGNDQVRLEDQALELLVVVCNVLCWNRYDVPPAIPLNVVPDCVVQLLPLLELILYSPLEIPANVTVVPLTAMLLTVGTPGVAAADQVLFPDQALAKCVAVCTVCCWNRYDVPPVTVNVVPAFSVHVLPLFELILYLPLVIAVKVTDEPFDAMLLIVGTPGVAAVILLTTTLIVRSMLWLLPDARSTIGYVPSGTVLGTLNTNEEVLKVIPCCNPLTTEYVNPP